MRNLFYTLFLALFITIEKQEYPTRLKKSKHYRGK